MIFVGEIFRNEMIGENNRNDVFFLRLFVIIYICDIKE